jgi:hypothetical protein
VLRELPERIPERDLTLRLGASVSTAREVPLNDGIALGA